MITSSRLFSEIRSCPKMLSVGVPDEGSRPWLRRPVISAGIPITVGGAPMTTAGRATTTLSGFGDRRGVTVTDAGR